MYIGTKSLLFLQIWKLTNSHLDSLPFLSSFCFLHSEAYWKFAAFASSVSTAHSLFLTTVFQRYHLPGMVCIWVTHGWKWHIFKHAVFFFPSILLLMHLVSPFYRSSPCAALWALSHFGIAYFIRNLNILNYY